MITTFVAKETSIKKNEKCLENKNVWTKKKPSNYNYISHEQLTQIFIGTVRTNTHCFNCFVNTVIDYSPKFKIFYSKINFFSESATVYDESRTVCG